MGGAEGAATRAETGGFEAALGPVLRPALAGVADRLAATAGLGVSERRVVLDGLGIALTGTVLQLTSRLLVLELNAARVTGQLRAIDPARRWAEFLEIAGEDRFWRSYLPAHYPTLMARLDRVVAARCAAAVTIACRFAADRDELSPVVGTAPGELTALAMGAGDSHGGQTVSIVRCTGGAVVYKPRPLHADLALSALLRRIREGAPAVRIDVPAVLSRDGYGWARCMAHLHCADDGELRLFYRGIGHWLGVMRLLGGTDMHAENLMACGPEPVVVDCETIFTPYPPATPSGLGEAADRAVDLVRAVLRIGMLPARRGGGRREDGSAAGNLPDQQPAGAVPVILDRGTDTARLGAGPNRPRRAQNHPSPAPELHRFWPELLAGFDELTGRLVELDRAGELAALLDAFRDCRIRVVARSTSTYTELGWMLWHPVSLHDEPAAVRRATELMAAAPGVRGADEPNDPAVIAAEIADLLVADVPVFTTTPGDGRLTGPGGVTVGEPVDLVADALHRWRAADRDRERDVARASLASAYLPQHRHTSTQAGVRSVPTRHTSTQAGDEGGVGLERCRRAVAAELVRRVRNTAVRGEDGTATWIAPVLGPGGWYVHALGPDLYGGAPGVAVALAGYLHEVRHGRADPVDGLPELLDDTLRTVRLREDGRPGELRLPGTYLGLTGRIWSWLTLAALGHDETGDAVSRAVALAELISVRGSPPDVFAGVAGAIVALLHLAEVTGQGRWTELAADLGRGLGLPVDREPGFAYGAAGVGWALARLAAATGDPATAERAAAAFDRDHRAVDGAAAFDRDRHTVDGVAAFDRDRRLPHGVAPAWCHGTVGIGLAAADLLRRTGDECHRETLRRAATAALVSGPGADHTLCHGELGRWELLDAALEHGVAPSDVDHATLDAEIVQGLAEHGPVLPDGVPAPGLMTGLGGIAYQVLRMHPDCDLPSVLLPGDHRW